MNIYDESYPPGKRIKWVYTTHLAGSPEYISVCCPRCCHCAVFEEPFLFYKFHEYTGYSPCGIVSEAVKAGDILTLEMSPTGGFRLKNPAPDLRDNLEPIWHGWLVVEKYPYLYHWRQPPDDGFYDTYKYGVVKCRNCHFVGKHQLSWPSDAYYHWDIRGNVLWAWSKEHARQLLLFIGGVNRNPDDAEGWMYRLPKRFLTAKVRPLVVKSITQSLAEQSC